MANRYSQYVSGVNYNPESFRDMSVVPIALRQRHDQALAAQDDLLLQLNNIQVRDEDKDYYNQKREDITNQVNILTDKINSVGAGDSNLMGEFRNMKRAYNKEVSLSGGLGQAANIKQSVDQARANYMDFGVKQGWSPETATKNFEQEYNNWKTNNDSSNLGTEGFRFNQFNPTFAPKQINPVDKLKEIQPLIGEISKEEAFQNYRPVQDPNTGMITYQSFGGTKLSRSNLERLASVEKFLNQELMNPDSELRQSLRYSRPGVDEKQVINQFLSESDLLIDAMGIEATKVATQLEAPQLTKGTTDKTKSGSTDEPASLVSTPTGAETFNGKSITDINTGTQIKQFEQIEKSRPLTEEESNQKMMAILQQDRVRDALKDPNVTRDINNYLKTNSALQDSNGRPSTIEGYNKTLSSLQEQVNNIKSTELYKTGAKLKSNNLIEANTVRGLTQEQRMAASREYDKALYLENRMQPIKSALDEAYNNSIPKDDLKYSRLYTFGAGEAANKAKTEFNKSATNYGTNFATLLENSGGKFTLPGETDLHTNNDEDKLKDFKESLASGQLNFDFGSLIDMGSTGSSQLVINYTVGAGEKAKQGMISIDYDSKSPDTSVLDNWLIQMQKTLDTPGQAVIQSILDNKQLKGISVDSQEFAKSGFSKGQSDAIKKMSKAVNTGYNNSPDYKAVDYNNFPDREYNMVLNKDGFYQLYLRDKKQKEANALSTQGWMQKELTKDYLSKKINSKDVLNTTDINDRRYFVSYMKDLSILADNNLLQVDNNSSSFQKVKNEYISEVNKNSGNLALQYELALEYYKSLQNMSIAHKNKKRNL